MWQYMDVLERTPTLSLLKNPHVGPKRPLMTQLCVITIKSTLYHKNLLTHKSTERSWGAHEPTSLMPPHSQVADHMSTLLSPAICLIF